MMDQNIRYFFPVLKKLSTMTFSCKNFDFNTDNCMKLNTDCIPGRPGCVLEGKVKFSEDIENKLQDLQDRKAVRKRRKRSGS